MNVLGGSSDDIRSDAAVELVLGDDRDLVGQVGAELAKRNRLVKAQAADDRGEFIDAGDQYAPRLASAHDAGTAVAFNRPVFA